MNDIDRWLVELDGYQHIIKRIVILRDKWYAHTDRDRREYTVTDLTFNDTRKVVAFCERVVEMVYYKAFDAVIDKNNPLFSKENFNLIEILATEYNSVTQSRLDEYKKRRGRI